MNDTWFWRIWFSVMGTLAVLAAMLLIVALLLGVPVLWDALVDTYGGGS